MRWNKDISKTTVPRAQRHAVVMGAEYEKTHHMILVLEDVKKETERELVDRRRYADDPQHEPLRSTIEINNGGAAVRCSAAQLREDPELLVKAAVYHRNLMAIAQLESSLDYITRGQENLESAAAIHGMAELAKDIRSSEGLLALSFNEPKAAAEDEDDAEPG